MDEKERAEKDIAKLERIIEEAGRMGLEEKYPQAFEWARNYLKDSKHYYGKGDYFTSFGAANYAYGFIDCVLVLEGKKDETNVF